MAYLLKPMFEYLAELCNAMLLMILFKYLRIHDTFTLKKPLNETFGHFHCSTLIPRQDEPHKVYISLKLRAF